MADYYTKFSLILPLPNEDAQKYAVDLAANANQVHQADEPTEPLPDFVQNVIEDWQFEAEAENRVGRHGLWLYSENGGIDAACAFIQHLLRKFDPQGQVSFEWSHDCCKPRTDAYGGGAAVITSTEIQTMNTSQWLASNGPSNSNN